MSTLIFMATYNGEKYIEQQLKSLISQREPNITLMISDDNSTDNTLSIIEKYSNENYPNFKILPILNNIPNDSKIKHLSKHSELVSRASNNFRNMIIKSNLDYDYYAFCDQDDVWYENKITRGISKLNSKSTPMLYSSATNLINDKGEFITKSNKKNIKPCFKNSLVQSIASGNTMIMNKEAFKILKKSLQKSTVPAHDWWAYIIISGSGGEVYYDPEAFIDYRIHEKNVTGTNYNIIKYFERIIIALKGNYKNWNNINCDVLQSNIELLNKSAKQTLNYFIKSKESSILKRNYFLYRSGVFREKTIQNILLNAASFVNKV